MTNSNQPIDLTNIAISDDAIIAFFFWAFAILFSLFYVLFAIILTKQTGVLNRSLKGSYAPLIFFISSLQIPIAAGLLIFSIANFGMMFL
jgi:uncharacterized membrane protein